MLEREFQETMVVPLARTFGWWVKHNLDERRSTPGWPDLVLLRGERALFVELKTDTGRLRPDQVTVLGLLLDARLEVRVWRPRDLDLIAADLRARTRLDAPLGARFTTTHLAQEATWTSKRSTSTRPGPAPAPGAPTRPRRSKAPVTSPPGSAASAPSSSRRSPSRGR